MVHRPDMPENPRVLRVVLLGAPNAGKSTLSNQLLGRKVCCILDPSPSPFHFSLLTVPSWIVPEGSRTSLGISFFRQVFPVSKKVHTTRSQVLGVITEKETQVVGTCNGCPANKTEGEAKIVSLNDWTLQK